MDLDIYGSKVAGWEKSVLNVLTLVPPQESPCPVQAIHPTNLGLLLLGVIAIYHMVYFVAKFALGVGGGVPSN